jgi:hypothetical protein
MRLPLLVVLAFTTCTRPDQPLTVSEALRLAHSSPGKKVAIKGYYYIPNIGGASLLVDSLNEIDYLRMIDLRPGPQIPSEQRGSFGGFRGTLEGQLVLVTGVLRPAEIWVLPQASVEVHHLEKANKALEPTTTSVTSPAAQEPRQP